MAGNKDKIQLPTNTTDISTLVRYLKGIKEAEPLNNNTAQSVYQAVKATGRKQSSYTAKVAEAGGKIPARDTHTTGTLATYGLIRYVDNNRPANFVVSDLGCELISLYDDAGKPITNETGVQLYSNGKYTVMLLRVFSAWHETGKGRNIHPGKIILQLMSDPDLDYYITEHDVAYFTSNSEFMFDSQYEEIKKSILEFRSKYDGVYGLTSKPCKAEIFMPTFVRNWGIFEKKEIFDISPDDANPGRFVLTLKNAGNITEDEMDITDDGEENSTDNISDYESITVNSTVDTDPEGLGKSIDPDKLYKNLTHYVLANGSDVYCDMVFRNDGNLDWIYVAGNELNKTESSSYEENNEQFDEVDLESIRLSTGCNVLLYGVPGSGKSWTIEHEYCKPGTQVERLVFHPDYTYSDFIGQILPAVAEDGQVSYKFTPGPFTNILREAYNNPKKEYVLIIEEINRGNAPAIFGEVFQLLDRKVEIRDIDDDGFPIGTSEYGITNMNIAKEMYGKDVKNEKVRIPSNLSIIGTMNTSDQNVFTLDTAFQRRWDMRLIENDFANVDPTLADAEILDTTVTWRNFCVEINKIVVGNSARMTSAEDKRLGAYFVHLRDLKFNDAMGDLKVYDALRKKESNGTLTDDEKTQIAIIRDAIRQNRKFPEKVIKYLWDDAFKFNREVIFEVTEYQSLEQVIRAFMYAQGLDRFKVFKDNVKDAFTGEDEE